MLYVYASLQCYSYNSLAARVRLGNASSRCPWHQAVFPCVYIYIYMYTVRDRDYGLLWNALGSGQAGTSKKGVDYARVFGQVP